MKMALHNLMERIDFAYLARSTHFKASAFRGLGHYDERLTATLTGARIAARELFTNRPVAIYGVTVTGRCVWVENVDLKRNPLPENNAMLYVTHYRCPKIDDVRVCRMPAGTDRTKAAAFVTTLSEDRGALIIETSDDLSKMSGPLMVKLYNELIRASNERNELTGSEARTTVTKFESLTVARPRVYKEIVDAAVDVDEGTVTTAVEAVARGPEPAPVAPLNVATEPTHPTEGEPTMAKAASKRKSKVDPASKISLLAEENPKRKGTAAHKRFELYRNGMLVSTFLDKGGTTADLAYDSAAKYIKIEKP